MEKIATSMEHCVSVIKVTECVPVAERMKKREDMLRIQLRPVSVLRRNPQTVLLNLVEENNLALCRARTQVQR